MERYGVINKKNKREIVLLKSRPCIWGMCSFCDYIEDNSNDENEMAAVNSAALSRVTGIYNALEVINSGSVFELPEETLVRIKEIVREKGINKLFLEAYYAYKNRLDELRVFFDTEIIYKCGIETFDNDFRNNFLNKGIFFDSPAEVAQYFDSVCLMVGIGGQTKEMIRRDIDILLNNFKYGCINLYTDNTTDIKASRELQEWFKEEYSYLEDRQNIDILYNNTDFGVGGISI